MWIVAGPVFHRSPTNFCRHANFLTVYPMIGSKQSMIVGFRLTPTRFNPANSHDTSESNAFQQAIRWPPVQPDCVPRIGVAFPARRENKLNSCIAYITEEGAL